MERILFFSQGRSTGPTRGAAALAIRIGGGGSFHPPLPFPERNSPLRYFLVGVTWDFHYRTSPGRRHDLSEPPTGAPPSPRCSLRFRPAVCLPSHDVVSTLFRSSPDASHHHSSRFPLAWAGSTNPGGSLPGNHARGVPPFLVAFNQRAIDTRSLVIREGGGHRIRWGPGRSCCSVDLLPSPFGREMRANRPWETIDAASTPGHPPMEEPRLIPWMSYTRTLRAYRLLSFLGSVRLSHGEVWAHSKWGRIFTDGRAGGVSPSRPGDREGTSTVPFPLR